MNIDRKFLLEWIRDNSYALNPNNFFPKDPEALTKFQSIAIEIEDMYQEKLIKEYRPHIESYSGKNYIDSILHTGLTPEGFKKLLMF
jgi:hypothetical protein